MRHSLLMDKPTGATMKKPDKFVFWSHKQNGWHWTVWSGAKCIAEGHCRTEREANEKADNALAQL